MAEILVLGGTAWLGREVARLAVADGHRVSCLARGESGAVAEGVHRVTADRSGPDAYAAVVDQDWDLVVDVSRQPGQVRGAVDALAGRASRWVFVSTINVYDDSDPDALRLDETDPLVAPLTEDVADLSSYGPGKVACEQLVGDTLGDRAVIARVGLIGGPGDGSGRSTYWPRRFATAAAGGAPVLVPDVPDAPVQLIDAGDLAAWLLRPLTDPTIGGPYDVAGPTVDLAAWLDLCRARTGHDGELIAVDPDWLAEQQVTPWMGPRSLPLWLPPEAYPMLRRPAARARAAGLATGGPAELIDAVLAATPPTDEPLRSGLTDAEEAELIESWRRSD